MTDLYIFFCQRKADVLVAIIALIAIPVLAFILVYVIYEKVIVFCYMICGTCDRRFAFGSACWI